MASSLGSFEMDRPEIKSTGTLCTGCRVAVCFCVLLCAVLMGVDCGVTRLWCFSDGPVSCKATYLTRCALVPPFSECCTGCEISGAFSTCTYHGSDNFTGSFEYSNDKVECLEACGEFEGRTKVDLCPGGEVERILAQKYGASCPLALPSLEEAQAEFCANTPAQSFNRPSLFTTSRVRLSNVDEVDASDNECIRAFRQGCAEEDPYNTCCQDCRITDATITCHFTGPGSSQGEFSFGSGDEECLGACKAFADQTKEHFCGGALETTLEQTYPNCPQAVSELKKAQEDVEDCGSSS